MTWLPACTTCYRYRWLGRRYRVEHAEVECSYCWTRTRGRVAL